MQLHNPGLQRSQVQIGPCPYSGQGPWAVTLEADARHTLTIDTRASGGWYDLRLQGERDWMRRLAGRLETGLDSISDPLMGHADV